MIVCVLCLFLTVCVLCLFLTVPWVDLQSVLVAFPGHIHFLFKCTWFIFQCFVFIFVFSYIALRTFCIFRLALFKISDTRVAIFFVILQQGTYQCQMTEYLRRATWKTPQEVINNNWAATWDFQQCGMCDQQSLGPACAYAQSDQSLC